MSRQDNFYTVNDFAQAVGTTKDTLLHYDRIGLFCPEYVAENGYRYYSPKQIWLFTQIRNLKKMDVGLKDIRSYMDTRTPENYLNLLKHQMVEAEEEIERLHNMIDSMEYSLQNVEDALGREEAYRVVHCEPVWGIRTQTVEEAFGKDFLKFWKRLETKYDFASSPLTGAIRMDEILAGIDLGDQCDYLYLRLNPKRHPKAEIVRPEGDFLIGYHTGRDADLMETYEKMVSYAKKEGLMFGEYAYEEYLIGQIAVSDSHNNVTKIYLQLAKN
ncbi:MAG: MerR family transcriptional regulator [Oscillospiraceae bacterium]|nr:MerR family transcriptional regulator [Oscillospiraceae bacterium]